MSGFFGFHCVLWVIGFELAYGTFFMAFLLPPIRQSRSCSRCGLRYPGKGDAGEDDACPHCSGLTESELLQLKEKIELRKESLRDVGQRMYLLAAIVAVFTLLLLLLL